MFEIIENNHVPKPKTQKKEHMYERTCDKCNSVFRYTESDVEDEDRGLFGPYTFVVCPCCGAELGHYHGYKKIKIIE